MKCALEPTEPKSTNLEIQVDGGFAILKPRRPRATLRVSEEGEQRGGEAEGVQQLVFQRGLEAADVPLLQHVMLHFTVLLHTDVLEYSKVPHTKLLMAPGQMLVWPATGRSKLSSCWQCAA